MDGDITVLQQKYSKKIKATVQLRTTGTMYDVYVCGRGISSLGGEKSMSLLFDELTGEWEYDEGKPPEDSQETRKSTMDLQRYTIIFNRDGSVTTQRDPDGQWIFDPGHKVNLPVTRAGATISEEQGQQSAGIQQIAEKYRDQIIGKLQAEYIESLSDAELERCIGPCGARMLAAAKWLRDVGALDDMEMNPYVPESEPVIEKR